MDAGLRRQLDPTGADCPVCLLDEIELFGNGRDKRGDVCSAKVDEAHS
jgi:hypothetical protein